MSRRLPEFIEPLRLVEKRQALQGDIALSQMKRLVSLLSDSADEDERANGSGDSDGDVRVDLQFGVDDSGQANIRGMLTARLQLNCQRCMQPMKFDVEAHVSLAIVHNDSQAKNLPDRYEPLLLRKDDVSTDKVSLTELVEDELLLALPAIAMHKIEECPAGDELLSRHNDGSVDETVEVAKSIKPNPFAVLEQLKKK